MEYYRLYPYDTDDYDTAEISVTNGITTELLPSALYLKQDLILRMNQTPYIDSSPNNLSANANQGLVTIAEDATLGRNVAVFNGSSNLLVPDSATLFGSAISQLQASVVWNQDATQTADACIAHYSLNGVKFRFLISAGKLYYQVFHSDGSSAYLSPVITKGVWNTATIYVVNNPSDVTFYAWLNGSYVGSKTTAGKSGSTTISANTVGSEPSNISYFKGYIADVTICGEVCTTDESLELNTNSIRKYPTTCYYRFSSDITDAQMLQFGDFDADNDGTVTWRCSVDSGITFQQYDGIQWTTEGDGYNSVATVSANISTLPATNRTIQFKAQLTSDGWTQVNLRYLQLGYATNLSPVVYPGTAINAIIGTLITPGAGFSYSDPDDNVVQLYYKWDAEAKTPVDQGVYGSQLEALHAMQIDTTGFTAGNYAFTVYAQDALGLEDSASIQVCLQEDTLALVYALLQTVSGNVDLIKPETDKIQSVKTTVEAHTTALVNIEADTTSIETKVDTANANILVLDTNVDSLVTSVGTIDTNLDAIIVTVAGMETQLDEAHDRLLGAGTSVDTINSKYIFYKKNGDVLAEYSTFDETDSPSVVRVLKTVKV